MYSIGEFSRISGLSIKALRLYHEKGLLVPGDIDTSSGYRYYDHKNAERARIIKYLRDMEFSLSEVSEILKDAGDEADVAEFFEKKRQEIVSRIRQQKTIVKNLDEIINREKEAIMASNGTEFAIEEKDLEPVLVAGVRYKGRYDEVGNALPKVAKAMGRHIAGQPFNLYYDAELKEEGDADIESAFPVRGGKNTGAMSSCTSCPAGKRCL